MQKTRETPVLDLLASMTADSIEASSLDAETLMLARIAALVAVDAPPVSYALNLEAAGSSRSTPSGFREFLRQSPRSSGPPVSRRRRPRSFALSTSS